jgi:O-antigen/teichoic acid export membrane protein
VHPVLAPLVLWVGLGRWVEFLGAALRARGRRSGEAAVLVCLRAAGLAAASLALARGLEVLAWSLAGASLLPLALAAGLVARTWRQDRLPVSAAAGVATALRASLPLGANGVLALTSLRVELLALVALRSELEGGVFAAALKMVEFLALVPSAIAAGAMPALTRDAALGRGRALGRTAATVAFLGVPAALGLALLAPGLVPRVFGAAFAVGAGPLRLLALALVPMFMNAVLMHALVAAGHARVLPRLTAVRVGVALALAAALVPAFGVAGAAAGFVASEATLLALVCHTSARLGLAVPVPGLLWRAACASLPMGAAVALSQAGPAGAALLGATIYALTLAAALRLSPGLRRLYAGAGVGYP